VSKYFKIITLKRTFTDSFSAIISLMNTPFLIVKVITSIIVGTYPVILDFYM